MGKKGLRNEVGAVFGVVCNCDFHLPLCSIEYE